MHAGSSKSETTLDTQHSRLWYAFVAFQDLSLLGLHRRFQPAFHVEQPLARTALPKCEPR
jgi:hypothetical protein